MNEYRLWLGKPGCFKKECLKLIDLLSSLGTKNLSIRLQPSKVPGFQWVLEEEYIAHKSSGRPGEITIFTSGTTGQAKAVTQLWDLILKSKSSLGSAEDKWLLTFSPARWAGLSVISHCLKTGASLIIPDDLSLEAICNSIKDCSHISLTPSLFKKMLLSSKIDTNAHIKQITFGGEACFQSTIDSAKALFPHARISHIYAAAEFGDLVCSSDGKEGFKRLPGHLNASGELIIDNKSTGDLWEKNGDRFIFRGRKNLIINVGGTKINPIDIEKKINKIPGILECCVYGEDSPFLGQLLCADYVGTITELELTKILRSQLEKVYVPKLNRVSELKLTDAGKMDRK